MNIPRYFDIHIGSPRNMCVVMKNKGKSIKQYVNLSTFAQHVSLYGRISVSICEIGRK